MNEQIRVAVVGSRGRMGKLACEWVRAAGDLTLVAEIEQEDSLSRMLTSKHAEVALDFTTAEVARENAFAIINCGVRPVIGTSGLGPRDFLELKNALAARALGGLVVPNFSIGAVLAIRFCEEAARWFSAAEVIEAHHTQKADAPSGTARATAERIARARARTPEEHSKELIAGARGGAVENVRVHSLRLPGVVAHQETWFGGEGETLRITHDTSDRNCFRAGVLLALREVKRLPDLVIGLESLLFISRNS